MTGVAGLAPGGAISEGDLLTARHLARIGGEPREEVILAAAACLAELRRGSVCVVLDDPPQWEATEDAVAWPRPDEWLTALADSPLVSVAEAAADSPLRLVDRRLYLQRYWQDQEVIRTAVVAAGPGAGYAQDAVDEAVATMFADGDRPAAPEQIRAVQAAVRSRVTLLAGGPGTGKTWTVARILAVLAALSGRELRVAVAAPTGKAATRLQDAISKESPAAAPQWIRELQPSTIHRLLHRWPGSHERFRFNRDNPLPFDVVIIDEMSMVSLPLMARLLEAIDQETRVILVGDPNQLASVEAGAVFGDLVRMRTEGEGLVTLAENFRFSGQLKVLADAVRLGEVDAAIEALRMPGGNVEFIETADPRSAYRAVRADVVAQARDLDARARAGDAAGALGALETFRVLCAHRQGRQGVAHWSGLIDGWSSRATGRTLDGDPWYAGRPLIVTRNDYDAEVFNGEVGVVVRRDGRLVVVIDKGDDKPEFAPTQLNDVETLHAMTVHKAQGSQYRSVTAVLPPADSPLLTRELLYTAITRAQERVRIVGTVEAVRAAVGREVRRASGLGG